MNRWFSAQWIDHDPPNNKSATKKTHGEKQQKKTVSFVVEPLNRNPFFVISIFSFCRVFIVYTVMDSIVTDLLSSLSPALRTDMRAILGEKKYTMHPLWVSYQPCFSCP